MGLIRLDQTTAGVARLCGPATNAGSRSGRYIRASGRLAAVGSHVGRVSPALACSVAPRKGQSSTPAHSRSFKGVQKHIQPNRTVVGSPALVSDKSAITNRIHLACECCMDACLQLERHFQTSYKFVALSCETKDRRLDVQLGGL